MPSSQDPYGLGFAFCGLLYGVPDVPLVDVDLPGLWEVKIGAPGVAVVESERR